MLLSLWFQSTHPSRGATILRATGQVAQEFQSTHPSRGATPQQGISPLHSAVSIHAPLAGCDPLLLMMLIEQMQFQSTHPSRGATRTRTSTVPTGRGFNPRTPRGVRHVISNRTLPTETFQSTHPSRGATANGPTKGTFCHVFMGVTRHKYDFSRRFVPRPSFGTVLPPIFYHAIFCSLHLRAHKEPLR